jgi:hypothetical protein
MVFLLAKLKTWWAGKEGSGRLYQNLTQLLFGKQKLTALERHIALGFGGHGSFPFQCLATMVLRYNGSFLEGNPIPVRAHI